MLEVHLEWLEVGVSVALGLVEAFHAHILHFSSKAWGQWYEDLSDHPGRVFALWLVWRTALQCNPKPKCRGGGKGIGFRC